MLSAAVDMQAGQRILGDDVAGHHAADGQLHGQLGLVLHQQAVLGLMQAAGVAGVTEILLVFSFSTGHDELVSVDNNDVIARVDVRCVFRLVFATESESDFSGKAADNLIGCINHVPFTLHFKRLGREGFHYYSPINLAHTNAPQIIFKLGRINSRDDIIYNGRAMTKGQRSNREDRIIRKKSSQFNLIPV